MVLSELVKTNLRRLIRSKGALIALMVGPLLLMVVTAMAFDSQNTYSLNLGSYATQYSKDANTFIANLEKSNFQVTRFKTATQCTNALRMGTIVSCMIFTKEPSDEVAMYMDYSKINLVDSLLGVMGQRLSEQSSVSGANVTQNLLQRMEDARAGLEESRPIIVSLTTHNEHSTQKVNNMISALSALDLKVDQTLEETALESEDNKFIEWLSSLSGLVTDMIAQYSITMDLVREELDNVAISEGERQSILNRLAEGESALEDLRGQLDVAGKISQSDLDNLLALTKDTVGTLQNIQAELDSLQSFKKESVGKLNDIRNSLDANLLKFIQLQNALNKIDSSITANQLQDPQNLLMPLQVRVEPITTSTRRFELLFPTLLMMVVMFSAVIIGTALMVMQKQSPVRARQEMAPVKQREFTAAMVISVLVVVGVQVVLALGVGLFFFGKDLLVVLPASLLVIAVAASAFTLMGLVLGALFATEAMALFAAVMGTATMLVLSDLILPLEAFPTMIREILVFNPMMLGVFSIKRIVLFHSSLSFVTQELLVLGLYGLLCVGALAVIARQEKSFKPRLRFLKR